MALRASFPSVDLDEDSDTSPPTDMATPLERTIDRMGMGSYQWSLLTLCGLGWMADNMWLQAVAIILPRVQDHYAVPDTRIGWLSTSIFFGMMLGAVGWGTCSDLLGRTMAFNATLLLTSIFGLVASYLVTQFKSLCIALFFLGTAIGGSMPTDGTLFLENIPRRKQYLLTFLSVFFSFGAVLSAILGIIIIPSRSCPEELESLHRGHNTPTNKCDVDTQNLGWRYLLIVLSLITLTMFVLRIVFFKLYESPRYLVSTGRHTEAVHALKKINSYNGVHMDLDVEDVSNESPVEEESQAGDRPQSPESKQQLSSPSSLSDYQATSTLDESPLANGQFTFQTPVSENPPFASALSSALQSPPSPERSPPPGVTRSRRDSSARFQSPLQLFFQEWISSPFHAWKDKIMSLLTEEWRLTTLLVWAAWCLMSLAYTMFNVFLPKLLESRIAGSAPGDQSGGRVRAMWDVVIFTLGGCPGALLGAWMVETPLGRRRSLALSTFATAIFCAIFAQVTTQVAVTISSIAISLAVTTMWAVLYGMTPEIFTPAVRGTACGTASALSRIGGMVAPILGGSLLVIDKTLPVYTAVGVFIAAGICVVFLPVDETSAIRKNDRYDGYQQAAH